MQLSKNHRPNLLHNIILIVFASVSLVRADETLLWIMPWRSDVVGTYYVQFFENSSGEAIMDIDLLCLTTNCTAVLRVSGIDEIQAFNLAWRAAKQKFVEWRSVAISNSITNLDRKMPYSVPWTQVERRIAGNSKPDRLLARDCDHASAWWQIWFHANPVMPGGFCCGFFMEFAMPKSGEKIMYGGIQIDGTGSNDHDSVLGRFDLLINATDPANIAAGKARLARENELFR